LLKGLKWKPYGNGIYQTSVPRGLSFTSLIVNQRRAVRARWPNANPETQGLHTTPSGWCKKFEAYLPPKEFPAATEIHISSPSRNRSHFKEFQIGVGGTLSQFHPPESFWGLADPPGGGGFTYIIPTGIKWNITDFSSHA